MILFVAENEIDEWYIPVYEEKIEGSTIFATGFTTCRNFEH
jgi:hypothetical protein